jgi:hypothetical protein
MQYISFMYIEFRPILLSGLKIQNVFKNAKMGIYMSVVNWLEILRDFRLWLILENDAIWNVYNFFFHSKERMHEIKVWGKKSRTKRFGNSPWLRPGTKITQQNNLFTLKKNKGNQSVLISRVKRRITEVFLLDTAPELCHALSQ